MTPLGNRVSPGSDVNLRIETGPYSDVALLAVDAGLYALNNENKLDRGQASMHGSVYVTIGLAIGLSLNFSCRFLKLYVNTIHHARSKSLLPRDCLMYVKISEFLLISRNRF